VTKSAQIERKAARIVAQHRRNMFAGANQRLEQATRRAQTLTGYARHFAHGLTVR
jgi:hypothetical protein